MSGRGDGGKIVTIQARRIMLSNGTLMYEPLHISESSDEINTTEAAKITGLSKRRIQELCDHGWYKTARKKGKGTKSLWLVARREVLIKKQPPAD